MGARLRWLLLVVFLAALVGGFWLLWLREPEPLRYAVVRGDTLWKIAQQHGVSVQDLRSWNGLQGDLIEVGQLLLIRSPGSAEASGSVGARAGRSLRDPSAQPPSARPGLALPAERPCLAGPTEDQLGDDHDEPQLLASHGLSQAQVEAAMNAFVPTLFRCVPEGVRPNGSLQLQLTVACSGRVAQVEQVDLGGLDGELAACVAETLRYAPFPPHDMPDGFSFRYPLRFSW